MPMNDLMPGDRFLLAGHVMIVHVVDKAPGGLTQLRSRTWREWLLDLRQPPKIWSK